MARRPRLLSLLALLPALLGAADGPAGEAPAAPVLLGSRELTLATATAIIGNRGGPTGALIGIRMSHLGGWVDIAAPRARPRVDVKLDEERLVGIEQKRPIEYPGNQYEREAYTYVLQHAHEVSADDLRKAVRTDLTRIHLMEQPDRYKGEVIHVSGTVRRLLKFDSPRILWNDGLKEHYEAWIYQDSTSQPFCVLATSIPPGLALGENVNYDLETEGYFFKRYAYQAKDPTAPTLTLRWLSVPLLIAHELRPVPSPPSTITMLNDSFFPAMLAGIVAVVALVVGLTLWFGRGDRAVQHRLSQSRQLPVTFSEPADARPLPIEPFPASGPDGQ